MLQIWSSAQIDSVSGMLTVLGLGNGSTGAGHLLEAIWDRRSFGLSPEDFKRKLKVIKDLDKVWSIVKYEPVGDEDSPEQADPEKWSQRDTLLIDDSLHKAVLQPSNHLCVPEFTLPLAQTPGLTEDRGLLRVIGVLEALRLQGNISACLSEGGWVSDGGRLKSPLYWEREGRAALARLGIAAAPDFDKDWVKRVRSAG